MVLWSKIGVAFLMAEFEEVCKGNVYVSTLHAIDSSIVKLSRITGACVLWRGSTRAFTGELHQK